MRHFSATRTRVVTAICLAWLIVPAAFAGGARETETKITLTGPSTYISPAGPDATKHSLEVKNIQLQIDKNGVIKRYDFSIYNKTGQVVFSKADVQANGRGFFGEALNVGTIPSVSLPNSFSWAGVDQDNKPVPDGEYFYQLTAVDNWGASASTAPLSVVVDTLPPVIKTIDLDNNVISPDADGSKDELQIRLSTGPAKRWTERVLDANGQAIWTRETEFPGDTETTDMPMTAQTKWDPQTNSDGSKRSDQLPEGSYLYELTGTDHAGNQGVKQVAFRVSYAGSLIQVTSADGVLATNADRGLTLLPKVVETASAAAWRLEIIDQNNVVWRRLGGDGLIPDQVVFNGRGMAGKPENDSEPLKDGKYTVLARQDYDSGFSATDQTFSFEMDSTAPEATLVMDTADLPTNPALTPWFGGTRRAMMHFQLAAQEEVGWVMELTNQDGLQPAYRFPIAAVASPGPDNQFDWQWSGMVPAGALQIDATTNTDRQLDEPMMLPDGRWSVRVIGLDAAGNEGQTNPQVMVLQTGPQAEVNLVQDAKAISPGVAGSAEQVGIELEGLEAAAVEQITLIVMSDAGQEIYRTRARPELPLAWQGQLDSGLPAPDGEYQLTAMVEYHNGDVLELNAEPVSLEGGAERPVIAQAAGAMTVRAIDLRINTPVVLDPAGGNSVPVTFQVANTAGFPASAKWALTVANAAGTRLWATEGVGSPPKSIQWDGIGNDGSAIQGLQELTARWELTGLGDKVVVEKGFVTGLPVAKEGSRLRVLVPDILFAGNNTDPFELDVAHLAAKIDLLRRLGDRLSQVTDHRIIIEGYATYTGRLEESAMAMEQRQELIPLSGQRAREVQLSLALTGVELSSLGLAAKGGTNPVVAYADKSGVWKNRRVIVYLEPKD